MDKKEKTKLAILNYIRNPDLLRNDIERHNTMLHALNKKIVNIMNVTPSFGVIKENNNGEKLISSFDYDSSSKELLKNIKNNNEYELRINFPDLYLYTDHLNENNGEINESIL